MERKHGLEENNSSQQAENKSGFRIDNIGDEVDACQPRLRGMTLNVVLAFVAGAGFTLFGYDIFYLFPQKHPIPLPFAGMTKASCLHC